MYSGPDGPCRKPARDLPWYAALHRAHLGWRARRDLRRIGCAVFWPREVVRERRKDDVLRPFIPGYLFVQPGSEGVTVPLREILDAPDVLAVLGRRDDRDPRALPAGFVPGLLELAGGEDGLIDLASYEAMVGIQRDPPPPPFVSGEPVVVREGAWTSFPGTVLELLKAADGAERVRVLVEIFGRTAPVDLPLEHVEAA